MEATQVPTDRRMDQQSVVYKHNGILFSLKRKEILTQAATWINLENMMLSEISQSQKDKYDVIPLI